MKSLINFVWLVMYLETFLWRDAIIFLPCCPLELLEAIFGFWKLHKISPMPLSSETFWKLLNTFQKSLLFITAAFKASNIVNVHNF